MIDLGTLAGNNATSSAYGTSADGSVVVGYSQTSSGNVHAFRWSGGVMSDLGTLAGNNAYSAAYGVSADGSVVVGYSQTSASYYHAFRWSGGVMSDLGTLAGNNAYSFAFGVSADGSVVVGESDTSFGYRHAFRWSGGVMNDLGTLVGNNAYSYAYGVSADGSVVVGYSSSSSGYGHAFRWTGGVMSDLGTLAGSNATSYALATSADGSVVVGYSDGGGAFRWTAATGMKSLTTLLTSAGVNMTGITLYDARAVSANGQFIAGNGQFVGSSAFQEVYLVRYYDGTPAPIGGLTTFSSVQQSLNVLADSRFGVAAQHHGLAAPLLSSTQPIDATNQAGVYASVGSFSAGGYTRYSFGNGLTLLGGLAYAKETYPDADLTHSATIAGAARYVVGANALRPFIEGGGWNAPNASMSFSRTYANGAGTATGTGDTNGKLSYLYARAGLIFEPTRRDQIVLSGEYGRQHLSSSAYEEAFTAQNPFNAVVSSGTDRADLAKARVQWTHRLGPQMDATLWGAAVRGFNRSTDLVASVAGVGVLSPTELKDYTWAEYGARLGYKFSSALTLDVFANGVAGPEGIGTRTHTGVSLRVQY